MLGMEADKGDHGVLAHLARRLSNLSSANRLLFMPRLRLGHEVDLRLADWLMGKSAAELRNLVVNGAKRITLSTVADPRAADANLLSRSLQKLARQDLFVQQEQGTHDLHLGYPFVVGSLAAGVPILAPLVLFPCQLSQQDGKWQLSFQDQEPPYLNPAFLLAWSHYTGQPLPQDLLDAEILPVPTTEANPDHVGFMTMLYRLLVANGIELRLTPEVMADGLMPFVPIRKPELEAVYGPGMLEFKPMAVLGLFQQPDGYLQQDYDQFGAEGRTIEQFFATDADHATYTTRHSIREADTYLPLPYDTSQWQAIIAVRGGKPLVVQGPPGSGKSQLITNLIADFVSRGKTVALVCQKRVALDVVAKRLQEIGIQPWVALVHDYKEERHDLYSRLKSQVDRLDQYQQELNALGVLRLEQQYQSISNQIEQVLRPLEAIKRQLYAIGPAGISAKQLYQLLADRPNVTEKFPLSLSWDQMPEVPNWPTWQDAKLRLRLLLQHRQRLLANPDASSLGWLLAHYPAETDRPNWHGLPGSQFNDSLAQIQQDREAISAALPHLQSRLPKGATTLSDLQTLVQLYPAWQEGYAKAQAHDLDAIRRLDKDPTLSQQLHDAAAQLALLANQMPHLLRMPTSEITQLGDLVRLTEQQAAGWWGRLTWPYSNVRQQLKAILGQWFDKLAADQVGDCLRAELDAYSKYKALRESVIKSANLAGFGPGDHQDLQTLDRAQWVVLFRDRVLLLSQLLRDWPVNALFGIQTFLEEAEQLVADVTLLRHHALSLLPWLGPTICDRLWWIDADPNLTINQLSKVGQLQQQVEELDQYQSACPPWIVALSIQVIPLAGEKADLQNWKTTSVDDLINTAEQSLLENWIKATEDVNPELTQIGHWQLTEQEAQLQTLLTHKQQLAAELVVVRLKERTCLGLDYNRLQNRVTYRNLYDQVSKKQRLWPVRKLLSNYAEDALRLMPCWLTSPEAMAAMFGTTPVFDLMIVDEASQCYAERGLPALARAKQVVVVGDKMQLQPYSLYQVRYEATDEALDLNPDLDSLSLLDLASRYAHTQTLTGHYRSRHQSLIAFSNHHFYDGKLLYLPSPSELASKRSSQFLNNDGLDDRPIEPSLFTTPIKVHYIPDGIWADQRNQAEAEAVVDHLIQSLSQSILGQASVGVITFNIHQQLLIQDLLEAAAQDKQLAIPPNWFVKSLEHVQGDEADIIIFSVAYAADKAGRIRAQYGSLSRAGGENRLNVGITRARQQLVVFSSLLPHQLPTDDSTNAGPRLLKAWLHYVWQVGTQPQDSDLGHSSPIPAELTWPAAPVGSLAARIIASEVPNTSSLLPVADIADVLSATLTLTDDDRFAMQPDGRAEFGLLPLALRQAGWQVQRVWERSYHGQSTQTGH